MISRMFKEMMTVVREIRDELKTIRKLLQGEDL